MTDWDRFTDAYGSAGALGELLDRAHAGADVWDELWSRLCHQGTTYPASLAALPHLTDLAETWAEGALNQALYLAASILASTDGPTSPTAVHDAYSLERRRLRVLADREVEGASDDGSFIYAVQARLATDGHSVWSRRLEALVDGELEVVCLSCETHLIISFEDSPAVVSVWSDTDLAARTVNSARTNDLVGASLDAFRLARTAGRIRVAASMLDLFGGFECPRCGAVATTSDALA